jgi:UDP:flavonoid glycosyltransferase YjiC (YdhE family)
MQQGRPFFDAAADACRRLGCRGVLLTRYRQQVPERLPPNVRHFDYVPFSRLLPRSAALVHHGGIGTTAQALAAGIPQLVMPMSHDQPDNAARVERLGVGLSLAPRRFQGPAVAAALERLLHTPEVGARCRAVAERMAGCGAVEQTCLALEQLAGQAPN